MWKDNIEYIIKRYKRFLKEHGVYKRVLDIHLSSNYCKKYNITSLKALLLMCTGPEDFLCKPGVFCLWHTTFEGYKYWLVLSSLWREVCLVENYKSSNNSSLLAECKDLLINTQNIADPEIFADRFITKENREKIIQMRKRINRLMYRLQSF